LVDVDPDSLNLPPNSYLIVDGTRILPLTQAVINIGRRPDNQIAIEDARVSRLHAQLRAIKGRFVIFDLDSTGGTYVNSQRVNQCALYPGDVISLAGYPLVYGQETAGISETQRYSPTQES
jgi:pSer/pThr/pTyr-binding forkhead associated (FHA) protein